MDTLLAPSAAELQAIVARRGLCVTVYTETGPRVLLDDAIHETSLLLRRDQDDATRTAVLDRLRDAASDVRTPVPGGAAIFATESEVRSVPLQDVSVAGAGPRAQLADRFLVAPLFADLDSRIPVMVLALSQNSVRLVDAGAASPRIVPVAGMPTSLRSFDALDLTNDRETLAHLRTSEEPTIRERQYVRAVDDAIAEVIDPAALLVVAAAEPLAGLFAELSRHQRLARTGIAGNADESTPDELAIASLPAVERERAVVRGLQLTRLAEFPERHLVTDDPATVLAAGALGAIDTLFVDLDAPDSDGFAEEAARAAHACRARVVRVSTAELPEHGIATAILRYPVDADGSEVG